MELLTFGPISALDAKQVLLALSLAVVALWWAQSGNRQANQPVSEAETVHVVSDYITVTSVDDMIQQSSTIVIGTVVKIADHRNLARMPSDSSKADSRLTIVGTVYEVAPEKYLKGTLGKSLLVVQSEGFLPYSSSLGPADLSKAQSTEAFTPLTVGGRYILFLQQHVYFPDLQIGVAEPYRFRLENGQARVESSWQGAADLFAIIREDALLKQVQSGVTK